MRLGVVADDITGAGDIGGMTAGAGRLTHIYSPEYGDSVKNGKGFDWRGALARGAAEVAIVDTDSRLDPPGIAYDKAFAATRALQEAGCRQFFNKTCSVFRGNIGAEFDAMLDALNEDFAVVVLGFPRNGRITRDGIHYVHGVRLEESPFRHDPVHPMTESNLVDILQRQTRRTVALVNHDVVTRGVEALGDTLRQVRSAANYAIVDVVDQGALATIARAVDGYRVLCGSSALAEPLAQSWGPPPAPHRAPAMPGRDGLGVLCIAGSLTPQTFAQTAYLKTRLAGFTLETDQLFDSKARKQELDRLTGEVAPRLARGEDVFVQSASSASTLEETRRQGEARGLAREEIARLVSGALADLALDSRRRTGLTRMVVAGGDTSAAVCRKLDLTRLAVCRELAPGLPSCVSLPVSADDAPMFVVLKSGSFGDEAFLETAIRHVKEV